MGDQIQIARGLYERLWPLLNQGLDLDTLLEDLLFEVPDEILDVHLAIQNPVDVEVGAKARSLIDAMAVDFGLTPLGLTVWLDRLLDKTMAVRAKFEAYVARTS